MASGYIWAIFPGFTAGVTQNSFVRVGFIYADGVRVPVGGAEVWGACVGRNELFDVLVRCGQNTRVVHVL